MALSRSTTLTLALGLASIVVARPAQAQRQGGYTPQMIMEMVRNGVADEKIMALVRSGCLAKPLTESDGSDLRRAGGSAELVMRLGRECPVGGESSASSQPSPSAPAAPVAPAPSAGSVVGGVATIGSGAASAASGAVQQMSQPVSAPPAAPPAAPAAAPEPARTRSAAPQAPTAKERAAAAIAAERMAIPSSATLDVAGLGAVKSTIDFFECPALTATPERFLGPSADKFDSRLARFVCARVKFVSAQPAAAPPSLKLQCKYDKDGGTLAFGEMDGTPPTGSTEWEAYIQYGKDDYDNWKNGQYNVYCDYGVKTVLRGPFSVFTSGAVGDDIPSLKARVLTIRTFATGPQVVPLMERTYSDTFVSEKTRMIGLELQVLFPPPDGKTSETVGCVWTHVDTGKALYTDQLVIAPKPESFTSIKATANGFADPGGWTSGNYTVDCSLGTKVIATTKFTVK